MSLIPFQFGTTQLRVIEADGVPWFVAGDVCRAIGLANARDAISVLDDDEKGVVSTDTPGGQQSINIVSESGLYTLILRSRDATKPGSTAHQFRKWVTGTVLPQLRKSGTFGQATIPQTLPEALRLAADLAERNTALIAQVTEQAPKVAGFHRIADCEGLHTLTNAAKVLQLKPHAFCKWLGDRGWIFRQGGRWLAYQTHIDRGELVHKLYTPRDQAFDEPVRTFEQVLVTDKGMARLAALLDSNPKRSVAAQVAIAQISEALR